MIIFVLILHIVKKRIHINMLRNDLESFLQTSRELEQHVFDVVSKLVTTRTSQEDPPMTPKPDPEKTSSGHAISLSETAPSVAPSEDGPFFSPLEVVLEVRGRRNWAVARRSWPVPLFGAARFEGRAGAPHSL